MPCVQAISAYSVGNAMSTTAYSDLTQRQHGAPTQHQFRLWSGNSGIVIKDKSRQQHQRGAARLRRPHQDADRRLSRLGMNRQHGHCAKCSTERAQDVGEAVRAPDQSEGTARTQQPRAGLDPSCQRPTRTGMGEPSLTVG